MLRQSTNLYIDDTTQYGHHVHNDFVALQFGGEAPPYGVHALITTVTAADALVAAATAARDALRDLTAARVQQAFGQIDACLPKGYPETLWADTRARIEASIRQGASRQKIDDEIRALLEAAWAAIATADREAAR